MLTSEFKLLSFFLIFNICAACSQNFDCDHDKICIDSKCLSPCESIKCKENAVCIENGNNALCYCDIGFTGNATIGCTKLDHDPCDPNPCGPNSVCKQGEFGDSYDKKVGAYCLCKDEFYGKPPGCRTGCKTSNDCADNEVCDKTHKCLNFCDPSPCGPNAICRNDNHAEPRCSCMHGYFPQAGIGCRLKTSNDSRIPLKKIKSKLERGCENCTICTNRCFDDNKICVKGKCIKNPCTKYCDSVSNCGIYNRTLECYNAFDHYQNPFFGYSPEVSIQSTDPCADISIKPECGVAISDVTLRVLVLG